MTGVQWKELKKELKEKRDLLEKMKAGKYGSNTIKLVEKRIKELNYMLSKKPAGKLVIDNIDFLFFDFSDMTSAYSMYRAINTIDERTIHAYRISNTGEDILLF